MEFVARANESVGAEKSLRTLQGRVEFDYQVRVSRADAPNVFFYVIPMKQTGLNPIGLIEVGGQRQDDPRNPYSPYRVRYVVPNLHMEDHEWHHASIEFDFRSIPDAFYSIFAPRINEGSLHTGPARFLVRDVRAYSLR